MKLSMWNRGQNVGYVDQSASSFSHVIGSLGAVIGIFDRSGNVHPVAYSLLMGWQEGNEGSVPWERSRHVTLLTLSHANPSQSNDHIPSLSCVTG